jgi:hypothetical protein
MRAKLAAAEIAQVATESIFNRPVSPHVPAIVNMAFAAELYIKCLHLTRRSPQPQGIN